MRLAQAVQAAALLALLTLTAGCQTTIGNYFGNRARDFGECFHLTVGFTPLALGATVKVAGIAHVSVLGGGTHPSLWAGSFYGRWRPTWGHTCQAEGQAPW